jgi:hypothetical protein
MILTGENLRTQRITCTSATLSTANPTRNDPGMNLDIRSDRSLINRLIDGTVFHIDTKHKEIVVLYTN